MEILKYGTMSVDILLRPEDVESAVRQFICDCHPEYAKNWILNPKYNLGSVVFAGTEGDQPAQPSLPSVENEMLKKRIAELEHELKEITQVDEFDLIEFRTMSADVKQVKQNLEGLSVNCKDSPPSNEWLVEYLSQQAQLLEIALNKASEQEKKYHAEYEGISFGIHKQLKELKAENEMLRQSNLPSAEEDIRINEHITIHLSEFIENQKTRVNPLYVDTVGTESHERNIFIKIVEHLRQHRGWSDEQSKQEHN